MKYFAITTLAAAALALAACGETKNEDTVVPANETAAAQLNADGSVAKPTEAAPSANATEAVK